MYHQTDSHVLYRTCKYLVFIRSDCIEEVTEGVQHATRYDQAILNVEVAFRRVKAIICRLDDQMLAYDRGRGFEGHTGTVSRLAD